MLTVDHKKRIAAEHALLDPWVYKNAPDNHISQKALNELGSF